MKKIQLILCALAAVPAVAMAQASGKDPNLDKGNYSKKETEAGTRGQIGIGEGTKRGALGGGVNGDVYRVRDKDMNKEHSGLPARPSPESTRSPTPTREPAPSKAAPSPSPEPRAIEAKIRRGD